jgi:SAM-dependent methyltransferase
MEQITDWVALWRQLVEVREDRYRGEGESGGDAWKERARGFHQRVMQRWTQPDSSRDFLLGQVDGETTFLDVGAGTGAWALHMARKARHVTAVDPSPAMLEILRENIDAAGLTNVSVVHAAWPDADVEPHDVTLCAHAMYGTADLPSFVERLMEVTRRRCCLLMRAPLKDGVMSIAAQKIWGQPHDSPNFVIAYNVLLQMGIYPNVLMENTGEWGAWTSPTLEDAFLETKRKLGLGADSTYDAFLQDLLAERLTRCEDHYVWPPSMRSALVYWDVPVK